MRKIDKKVEDALRVTAKRSLQELSRAINGDAKSGGPHPLFKVGMMLDEGKGRVEFRPTMAELDAVVKQVSAQSIKCLQVITRLPDALEALRPEGEGDAKDEFM